MNLKKIGKVFMSKSVWTEPLSYKKNNLPGRGLTKVEKHCSRQPEHYDKTMLGQRRAAVIIAYLWVIEI